MTDIFLGIGGNLGCRKINIDVTIEYISQLIAKPFKISSLYMTEPWGFEHAQYFLNGVIHIKSEISLEDLHKQTLEIEKLMKRIKSKGGYEGRTMDIDILFFGQEVINNEHLHIPHQKLQDRLFVLLPMFEIAPNFLHPIFNQSISEILKNCTDKSKIRKLNYGI
jgi:2-amino-4-hydroxy-6-hydroxymethyldihydropteridine diphosphokinase